MEKQKRKENNNSSDINTICLGSFFFFLQFDVCLFSFVIVCLFLFFFFLRGSCLDFIRGFPFLSSLSLFLFFFSFVIQRCIIQPSSVSIAKIIFQFGADWLPFNLTRFHCRTSFICSKYAHLPLFCLTILILLKKKRPPNIKLKTSVYLA